MKTNSNFIANIYSHGILEVQNKRMGLFPSSDFFFCHFSKLKIGNAFKLK